MSKQGMTALYERVQSDESFRAQLQEASSPQDKHRIVSEAGFDVERADLDTLRSLAGMTELSDEDLERVAGGGGTLTGVDISVGITASGGAAAFAAALAF